MIDKRTIFEIHRLFDLGWSERKIARHLRLARPTVRKYLQNPESTAAKRKPKSSKLDPFRDHIKKFLKQDPDVKATVILQRIQAKGFDGEVTIIRRYLQKLRGKKKSREPFIRFESLPGEQVQIDWGHFGSLTYENAKRKLYALCVTECYSRMLYVEFTHSQRQEALHQALLNAFFYFRGTPKEIVVDNMVTAVIERQGALIRFNDAFLDFLRHFKIVPVACNVGAPNEKGKIEALVKYLRYNFWPLRNFKDLTDVQMQVRAWLNDVANMRVHQTTGEVPKERFAKVNLRVLPDTIPDVRETLTLPVYKDFAVRYDANIYTVPPWAIGKQVVLKADQENVTIYYQDKKIAAHKRCWSKRKRVETPSHREQVKKIQRKLWYDKEITAFSSLGQEAVDYLTGIAKARQPIKKNVSKLLSLKDEYGAASVLYAIRKALKHKAYGSDYIENILYQEMTPRTNHPPVKLKNDAYNRIRLSEPCLAEYDTHVLKKKDS